MLAAIWWSIAAYAFLNLPNYELWSGRRFGTHAWGTEMMCNHLSKRTQIVSPLLCISSSGLGVQSVTSNRKELNVHSPMLEIAKTIFQEHNVGSKWRIFGGIFLLLTFHCDFTCKFLQPAMCRPSSPGPKGLKSLWGSMDHIPAFTCNELALLERRASATS